MVMAIDSLAEVKAHWSADQITGSPADGDAISSLPDSVSGWTLSGTTTTRPLYKTTAGPNGLPSILFDGTDDYLQSASKSLTIKNPSICIIGSMTLKDYNTMFHLTTLSGVPNYGAGSSRIWSLFYNTGQALYGTGNGSGVSYISVSSLVTNNVKFMYTSHHGTSLGARAKFNGSLCQYAGVTGGTLNANMESAVTLYANFGRTSLAGSSYQGYLSEIVLWDETLLCESAYIEGVLAAKYGIALPTSHPFYSGAPTSGPSTGSSSSRMVNVRGGADQ